MHYFKYWNTFNPLRSTIKDSSCGWTGLHTTFMLISIRTTVNKILTLSLSPMLSFGLSSTKINAIHENLSLRSTWKDNSCGGIGLHAAFALFSISWWGYQLNHDLLFEQIPPLIPNIAWHALLVHLSITHHLLHSATTSFNEQVNEILTIFFLHNLYSLTTIPSCHCFF